MVDLLETPRLKLRRAHPGDVDALFAIFSRPDAMRWWSTLPHEGIEETREWLDSMITSPPELSDDFIVERDGHVIGKAGFWRLPEIGFIFHPDTWGQGVAFEAVSAVVDHVLMTRPDVNLVKADVDPANASCIRLLGRLGFEKTGEAEQTWQIGGVWMDSHYYDLSRERWMSRDTS